MTRVMTTAADAALQSQNVPMLVFVLMDFPSGFVRVNNSSVNIPWGGEEWLGVGRLGTIDQIEEAATLESRGMKFRISGVPQANVANALGQQYQGRDCKVWLAPLTADYVVISDPILTFWGRMDTMDIELGETATITVSAESRLADWDRARIRRYTHEDQQLDYPGDMGFEFVPLMAEKELRWGY